MPTDHTLRMTNAQELRDHDFHGEDATSGSAIKTIAVVKAMREAAADHHDYINNLHGIAELMAAHPAIDHAGVAEVEDDRKARQIAAWNRDAEVDA